MRIQQAQEKQHKIRCEFTPGTSLHTSTTITTGSEAVKLDNRNVDLDQIVVALT